MRQIEITKTQVFKRTASVTINMPDCIDENDTSEWLLNNEEWESDLLEKFDTIDPHHESELDEVRYDIYETKKVRTYGGTL